MIRIDIERKMLTSEGLRPLQIDVCIPGGELVAVRGKSGVGKTTLLRIVAGLLKPDRGFIQIGNTVVFDSAKKINLPPQRRDVGFMFQDYALFPNMTVEQNIAFGACRGVINRAPTTADLIETFDLTALRRQKSDKLSGGQKQRVALARALARQPKILLLDEPLSALDEEMRFALQQEILKAHNLLNLTTLMVSHDSNEIQSMATVVMAIGYECRFNNSMQLRLR
jgi:molybdate transport system ATP-binding protein